MSYYKKYGIISKNDYDWDRMEYEDFKKALKDNGLTLKAFSELSGVKYDTASKWGKKGRPVSDWVESWITHYAKSAAYDVIAKTVKKVDKALGEADEKKES